MQVDFVPILSLMIPKVYKWFMYLTATNINNSHYCPTFSANFQIILKQ